MMLKVGSEYLDFNSTVEVERKAKLFENLDSSDGDFSFQFDVPETSHNARLLNYPVPDSISKTVYHRVDCDLQDDSGVSLYTGFLRIERRVSRENISLSFFSGNSNWFGLISGNMMDMDMSAYDVEQTEANIITSWSNLSGLTFPLIDHGGLLTRGYPQVKIEDLVGGFYVHTVFKKIFTDSQIKLNGELFSDPNYLKLITIKNSKDQEAINSRGAYVEKDTNQVIAHEVYTKVVYQNDSVYPFFDGTANLYDITNSQFTADVKMNVRVESTLQYTSTGFFGLFFVLVYVNGVVNRFKAVGAPEDTIVTNSFNFIINLEAGDVLEIYSFESNTEADAGTILPGTLKITPTFIYKTFGTAALPNWTKQDYVSAIFQMFNVITSFEPKTKTLTCNLFDKIKEKEPIDISQYVQVDEVDYTEFISSYGKNSTFSYKELDFDDLKEYNIANFLRYGQGIIEVDNDFLPESESVIESDFSNPFSYLNPVFDMSMERTNLIELEEGEQVTFDDVADDGFGAAAFHISNEIFQVQDLVRISNSTNAAYNGDWVVASIPSGHITLFGIPFDTAASGDITKLDYAYSNNDDVFIFVNIIDYEKEKFSGVSEMLFNVDPQTAFGVAYFSLLNTNRQINIDYKQSLSFGEIQDPLFYQFTLLQNYWSLVGRVLNDPVKPICTAVMPANVYRSIDFLRPAYIKTLETSNLYYFNLLSGYKSSYEPYTIELIKLP